MFNTDLEIKETFTEFLIMADGNKIMSVDKSKFNRPDEAKEFATDIMSIFKVGMVTGESTGLMQFVNGLDDADHSKTSLVSQAKSHITEKYGDAVKIK